MILKRMSRTSRLATLLLCGTALPAVPLAAQRVTWDSRLTAYGDNTEFFTPYRTGETLLGTQLLSTLRARTGRRTAIVAGVHVEHRSGAEGFLDPVRPVLAFEFRSGSTSATLGALVPERRHGFLEPLQVTTLELTRPIEYGLSWVERRPRWDVDVYLNWQALNTPEQREVFDYGWVLRVRPHRLLSLESQLHGLHHGGQLFDAGVPVTNNVASGFGVTVADTLGALGRSAFTVYRLRSAGNIDPDAPGGRPTKGHGWYLRGSVTPRGWFELFALWWRGRDFLSQEGDNNYNSVGADPAFYRSRRRYTEFGLLRRVPVEGEVTFDGEFRLHRIDDEPSKAFLGTGWEYSYRLVVRAPFGFTLLR